MACVRAGLAPCSNNLLAPPEVDSVAADGHGYSTGDGYLKLCPCFPLGFWTHSNVINKYKQAGIFSDIT